MKWFLLWALGTTGVVLVALCIVLLFLRGRLRRRHRVDHKVATGAPLSWLVDPRSPARLHRRLARIGTTTDAITADHEQPRRRLTGRARGGDETPIATAAADIKARAVTADRQLARIASLAPPARRAPLRELARQIDELEHAATSLAALSAGSLTPRTLDHVDDDVRGQVDRLAAAQQELDALDADAGLRPAATNPLAPSPAPAPPPPPTTSPAGSPVTGGGTTGRQ